MNPGVAHSCEGGNPEVRSRLYRVAASPGYACAHHRNRETRTWLSSPPRTRNVSLDDLLKANKARFDRIFETQMGESARLDSERLPPSNGDLAARPEPTDDANRSGEATHSPGGESPVHSRTARTAAPGRPASASPRPGSTTSARPSAPDTVAAPRPVARAEPRAAAPAGALDPVTLDLIENALRNARHEMDAVLFRSAMSPVIREQHDEFPMITDPQGRMIVGQFGSYVPEMLAEQAFELEPGDVILQSDPYKCGGAISHINDWMVLIPIFFEDELVGFSSMFGHMMDVGGPVPGSMPTAATSIFGEGSASRDQDLLARRAEPGGARDPDEQHPHPGDELQRPHGHHRRQPHRREAGHRDLRALRDRRLPPRLPGAARPHQPRHAHPHREEPAHRAAVVRGLDRRRRGRERSIPHEAHGVARGRARLLRLDRHRPPVARPDQLLPARRHVQDVHRGLHDHGVRPPDTLQRRLLRPHPRHPAQGLARAPELPGPARLPYPRARPPVRRARRALSRHAPEMATAAGYGSSPHFLYSGVDGDGQPFQLMEILYGGIPGRPIGDGMDGHSWWPLFENIRASTWRATTR